MTADYRTLRQGFGSILGTMFFLAMLVVLWVLIPHTPEKILPLLGFSVVMLCMAAYFVVQILTFWNCKIVVAEGRIRDYNCLGRCVLDLPATDIKSVDPLGGSMGYSIYRIRFENGMSLNMVKAMRHGEEILKLANQQVEESRVLAKP